MLVHASGPVCIMLKAALAQCLSIGHEYAHGDCDIAVCACIIHMYSATCLCMTNVCTCNSPCNVMSRGTSFDCKTI